MIQIKRGCVSNTEMRPLLRFNDKSVDYFPLHNVKLPRPILWQNIINMPHERGNHMYIAEDSTLYFALEGIYNLERFYQELNNLGICIEGNENYRVVREDLLRIANQYLDKGSDNFDILQDFDGNIGRDNHDFQNMIELVEYIARIESNILS